MLFSVSACGGNDDGDNGSVTVLEVAVHNGGVGSVWLSNAADRFIKEKENYRNILKHIKNLIGVL